MDSILNLSLQAADDDEVAFEAIFKLFYARLLQFAASTLRNREEAEEVVEDVFIKLWENRKTLTAIKNLNYYLFVVTKHTALNYIEKNKKYPTLYLDDFQVDFGEISLNPEECLISAQAVQKIQQIIEELPPQCKLIFKLIKEDGLKYKETASLLQLSIKTIESQMALALRKIGNSLRSSKENQFSQSL